MKELQQISEEYIANQKSKRDLLKKMVQDFFVLVKQEVEALYYQVFSILDTYRFENTYLDES